MANFVDYNEQLLKYKEAAQEGFININIDPKKEADPSIVPNKDGINYEDNTPTLSPTTNPSIDGHSLSYDVNNYTDENIIPAIKNEAGEIITEEIVGPSRQNLRASLAVPSENIENIDGIILPYSVDNFTDESTAEGVIGPIRQNLRASLSVPETNPNVESTTATANSLVNVVGGNVNLGDEADGVYQPVGSDFAGMGEIVARSLSPFYERKNKYEVIEATDLSVYKTRTENSITNDNLKMFIYSAVPFIAGRVAENVLTLQSEIAKFGGDPANAAAGSLGTIKYILATMSFLSYFNTEEIGTMFLATPFTLGYLATFGMNGNLQFKDGMSSVKWKKGILLAESWDISILSKNIESHQTKFETLLKQYKEIYGSMFKGEFKQGTLGYYMKEQFPSTGNENTSAKNLVSYSTLESLRVIRDNMYYVLEHMNYINFPSNKDLYFEFGKTKKVDKNETKDFDLVINPENRGFKVGPKNSIDFNGDFFNNYEIIINDELDSESGKNIYGAKASEIKGKIKEAKDNFTAKYQVLMKGIKSQSQTGYIMVYPTKSDEEVSKFKIPFQFNPTLAESGQAARYDAANMLHRQGQAFSYVQTEGQSLTLETEYLMLSDGKESEGTDLTKKNTYDPQDAFYKYWNPTTVQTIESALRSLVLPIAQNKSNGEIMFHKPPMIKIVMSGNDLLESNDMAAGNRSNLYQMLTYPLKDGKYYHRTYIVTKVSITRDPETPYYIINSRIADTHGFKVNLELTEIDHNYVGAAPDFMNYYNVYKGKADSYLNESTGS